MNHRAVMFAALLVAACAPRSLDVTDETRAAVVQGVREAVDDLFEAMNAHDADRVLRHYQRSEDFAYVALTDIEVGWETFEMRTRQWYRRHGETTFEHTLLHVHVLSPTEAVTIVRGKSSEGPSLVWTQVFVRDGGWKIAHEHEAWLERASGETDAHLGM